MLQRKAAAEKLLLLGVDGLDPRLTKKYVEKARCLMAKVYRPRCLPGRLGDAGWTSDRDASDVDDSGHRLLCQCPRHNGITGVVRISIRSTTISISRNCLAEPLWNVFAEAGKKTLVWHWPGTSWPPTCDNDNLMVIDGTSPGCVGMATSQVEAEYLAVANEQIKEVTYIPKAPVYRQYSLRHHRLGCG